MRKLTRKTIVEIKKSCIFIMVILSFSLLCEAKSIESPFNHLKLSTDAQIDSFNFLMAGHIYGAPENAPTVFPSASIIAAVDMINSKEASFFVSLGDNFRRPDHSSHIANFQKSFSSKITSPIFNAVGNHDIHGGKSRTSYEKYFGNQYYYDFVYGNTLFIFLDSELNKGEIKGAQLDYFQNRVEHFLNKKDIRNVFIFSHKLIWSVGNPSYKIVFDHLNSQGGYAQNNFNFKNEIEPYLIKLTENNVVERYNAPA